MSAAHRLVLGLTGCSSLAQVEVGRHIAKQTNIMMRERAMPTPLRARVLKKSSSPRLGSNWLKSRRVMALEEGDQTAVACALRVLGDDGDRAGDNADHLRQRPMGDGQWRHQDDDMAERS